MEAFSDKDTTTEILSRLPVKSLMAFKCTAKRWYNFVSDPLFLRIHYERVKGTHGLALQDIGKISKAKLKSVDLLTVTETGLTLKNNVLDFLPVEKVILLSSSNGILCCRSLLAEIDSGFYDLYICNPVTRQWVQLRYNFGANVIPNKIGIVFYPFSSSAEADSVFKLVSVKDYRCYPFKYSFDIYSSHNNKWKSSEVYKFRSPIHDRHTIIFINGWLHWKSYRQIIAFHVEKELCKVIELPHFVRSTLCSCLGESESYIHYVFNNITQIEVWVLKDYEKSTWKLKHFLDIPEFNLQFKSRELVPLAFYDDVVYIRALQEDDEILTSYDFRTKNCAVVRQNLSIPSVLQYCASLVPLHEPCLFQSCT